MTEENLKLYRQGAEAKVYLGNFCGRPSIIKERFSKKYRHEVLDEALCKERTKCEARSLVRCRMAGIKTPAIYFLDMFRNRLWLEYISDGVTLKEFIEKLPHDSLDLLAEKLGVVLASMHKNDIIHGDLTTSNILISPPFNTLDNITLIDFGLSHVEASPEDKGVDLYVLQRAFISTHPTKSWFFDKLIESYKVRYKPKSIEVLKKFDEITLRGRKRTMVG